MRSTRIRVLWLLVILVSACFGIPWYRTFRSSDVPNILLISIDTLRADHLGCYGYRRNISPNLDRFARQGILFENAFCVMPTTIPSHASILFGTWPRIHGSTNNHMKVANQSLAYLPRVMKEAGYATGAFVSAFHLGVEMSRDAGFDRCDWPLVDRPSDITLDRARKWLVQNGSHKFFLWIHLWEPHSPYILHPEFMKTINPGFEDNFGKHYSFLQDFKYSLEQRRAMIDLYDNEIAYADSRLGSFLDEFRSAHPNTVILIVSDHGETLDELAEKESYAFDHGEFLVDSQIHVPLIVLLPGNDHAGLRLPGTVSLIDLFPTIAEFCHLNVPGSCQGLSFMRYILNPAGNHPDSLVFLQRRTFKTPPSSFLTGDQFGVCEKEYKLLLNLPENKSVLFRNDDPSIHVDSKETRIRMLLERRLNQWLTDTSTFAKLPGQTVSPEMSRQLRALGYIQ